MSDGWQEGRTLTDFWRDPSPVDYHNGNIEKKHTKKFEPINFPRLRRDQLLGVVECLNL